MFILLKTNKYILWYIAALSVCGSALPNFRADERVWFLNKSSRNMYSRSSVSSSSSISRTCKRSRMDKKMSSSEKMSFSGKMWPSEKMWPSGKMWPQHTRDPFFNSYHTIVVQHWIQSGVQDGEQDLEQWP